MALGLVIVAVAALAGGVAYHEAPCHEMKSETVRHADLTRPYAERRYVVHERSCRLRAGEQAQVIAPSPAVSASPATGNTP